MTVTVPAGSGNNVQVTFDEAMPDTDYVVVIDNIPSPAPAEVGSRNLTKTGFTLFVLGRDETVDLTIGWQAFKLMTDAALLADEAQIEQNKTDIATLKAYDGSTTGTLAMSTRTGQSISTDKCVLIAKNAWFVDFSLTCTDSFTGVDYTLGQMPVGTLTIDGKSVYGVLAGKLYGSAYTDDSTAVTVTMPATLHPSQGWIFFGRQQGLAGTSSSSKFKTLGTNINRFAGILYASA